MAVSNIIVIEDTLSSYNSGLITKDRKEYLLRRSRLGRSKLACKVLGVPNYENKFNSNWKYLLRTLTEFKIPYDKRGSIILNLNGYVYRVTVGVYGYVVVFGNTEANRFETKAPEYLNKEGLYNFILNGGNI